MFHSKDPILTMTDLTGTPVLVRLSEMTMALNDSRNIIALFGCPLEKVADMMDYAVRHGFEK